MSTKPRKMPVGQDWREPAVQIPELDVLTLDEDVYFSDPTVAGGEAFIHVMDSRLVVDLEEVA